MNKLAIDLFNNAGIGKLSFEEWYDVSTVCQPKKKL